jgi:hypothetical protein
MKHLRYRLGIAAAAWCLAGCSAIQIDVDVYKGPLANEPDIQVQQFAALAIAARPLLTTLRNDIENEERRRLAVPLVEKEVPDARVRAGFLSDDTLQFRSRIARFVNGALFAYDDMGANTDSTLVQDYSSLRILVKQMQVTEQDRELAKRIAPPSKKDETFAREYRDFLCGSPEREDRGGCKRTDATPVYRGAPQMLYDRDPNDKKRDCWSQIQGDCTVEPRSNEGFDLLSHPERVKRHSIALFGKEDPAFVQRVVELGKSHDKARKLARRVALGSLAALRKAAASGDLTEIEKAAEAVADSVQPALIDCFLRSKQGRPLSDANRSAQHLLQTMKDAVNPVTTEDVGQLRKALRQVARDQKHARNVADLLVQVDFAIEPPDRKPATRNPADDCGAPGRVSADYLPNLTVPQARWYGIARGVNGAGDNAAILEELAGSVAAIAGNAAGFERARLPKGLDTLTREYREAHLRYGGTSTEPGYTDSRRELEESLLFFSERVLFVVNTLTEKTLKDELAGVDDTTLASFAARLATLQTLGNSLVLHANDLTRRRNQEKDQERLGPLEVRGAQLAYSPGAESSYDGLLFSARQELGKLTSAQSEIGRGNTQLDKEIENLIQAAGEAEARQREADGGHMTAMVKQAKLEAVLRTVLSPPNRPAALGLPADDNLKAQEDRDERAVLAAVEALVKDKTDPMLAEPMVAQIRSAVATIAGGDGSAVQKERWKAAMAFFDEDADAVVWSVTPKPLKPALLFDAVTRRLNVLYKERDDAVKRSKALLDASSLQAATARTALETARKKRQAAETPAATVASAVPGAEATLKQIETARGPVVNQAIAEGARDPVRVQQLLVAHLKTLADAAGIKDVEKKILTDAQTFVAQLTPLKPPVVSAGTNAKDTRRGVLDQVIADLRHQRIQALAKGDDNTANNLARAIEAAYEARQSGVFIRPSADYLKSVYSSTALAEGPQSPYRNLLLDYLKRLQPSDTDGLSPFDERMRDAKVQAEKLFWQNINRVTVSGGGDTNTVLAKDDVGNWYTKSYSADPEAIIQSAKSLALFSSGSRVNVDLLRKANLQRRADDTSLQADERDRAREDLKGLSPTENVGLGRVRTTVRLKYERETAAAALALSSVIAKLPAELGTLAGKNETLKVAQADFDTLVANAHDKHLKPAAADLKDAYEMNESSAGRLDKLERACVSTLKAMRRFYLEVQATAASPKTADADSASRAAEATKLVKTHVTKLLTDAADAQKRVLATFESGVQIVGDASYGK